MAKPEGLPPGERPKAMSARYAEELHEQRRLEEQRPRNARREGGAPSDGESYFPEPSLPEAYFARTPPAGIPATTFHLPDETGTGTGTYDDEIGGAVCRVFRRRLVDGRHVLKPVEGLTRLVFNPSSAAIGGNVTVPIWRDKYETWFTVPMIGAAPAPVPLRVNYLYRCRGDTLLVITLTNGRVTDVEERPGCCAGGPTGTGTGPDLCLAYPTLALSLGVANDPILDSTSNDCLGVPHLASLCLSYGGLDGSGCHTWSGSLATTLGGSPVIVTVSVSNCSGVWIVTATGIAGTLYYGFFTMPQAQADCDLAASIPLRPFDEFGALSGVDLEAFLIGPNCPSTGTGTAPGGCLNCTTDPPDTLLLDAGTIANGSCLSCTSVDGMWTLTRDASNPCLWQSDFIQHPCAGSADCRWRAYVDTASWWVDFIDGGGNTLVLYRAFHTLCALPLSPALVSPTGTCAWPASVALSS